MKRLQKLGGFALAVVLVGGLASRVVVSQQPHRPAQPPSPLPSPAPTPTAAAPLLTPTPADHLLEPLRPHLEAVLGAPLDALPQIRLATTAHLQRLTDPDLDAHLHWHFPQLRGDTLLATRQAARQIAASAAVAQYVEGTDIILVAEDAPARIAGWDASLAQANSPSLVSLAIVHETVRFLLDRRYGFANLRATCRDGEEHEALLAAIEGRAQAVTRKVADRLKQEALFPLLAQCLTHVPDNATDPGIRAAGQTALRQRYLACVRGLNFYAVLEDSGLADAEARVFARLPRQERTIARPDLWLRAVKQGRPDLASALQSLEGALPAEQWFAGQQSWTPAMLAQVAGLLGVPRERVERFEGTWEEGRSLIWSNRQNPGQQVAVSVVRHETPAAARAYFGFANELQRKQDVQAPGTCGPAVRVLESQSTAAKLEGFDEGVRTDKTIQYGGAAPVVVRQLLARAGDLVVECSWYGDVAETGLAERLAQAVRGAAK
jgi:hypothetical protein